MKTIGPMDKMSRESTVTHHQAGNVTVKRETGGLHSAKKIPVIFAVVFCAFLCVLFGGCGSKEPGLPLMTNLSDTTIQEYMEDDPVSMEVSMGLSYDSPLYSQNQTLFYVLGQSSWKQITSEKKLPAREKPFVQVYGQGRGSYIGISFR